MKIKEAAIHSLSYLSDATMGARLAVHAPVLGGPPEREDDKSLAGAESAHDAHHALERLLILHVVQQVGRLRDRLHGGGMQHLHHEHSKEVFLTD